MATLAGAGDCVHISGFPADAADGMVAGIGYIDITRIGNQPLRRVKQRFFRGTIGPALLAGAIAAQFLAVIIKNRDLVMAAIGPHPLVFTPRKFFYFSGKTE